MKTKTMKIILIVAAMLVLIGCNAKEISKIADKEFQFLLDKFVTVSPPINYKRVDTFGKDMTKKEAIKFFHKTKDDLEWPVSYFGEDDEVYLSTAIEEYVPGCKFKYQLNDSIYMLCIVEADGYEIYSTRWSMLYSFTKEGTIIDTCLIRGEFSHNTSCVSCVFFDKYHLRVFYYSDDDTRRDDGFLSSVYYINYIITDDGKFIEQEKSGIISYLKKRARYYSTSDSYLDDPMKKYDF